MSSSLDKLKALTSRLEERLEKKGDLSQTLDNEQNDQEKDVGDDTSKSIEQNIEKVEIHSENISAPTDVREANIERVKVLFTKLNIVEKSPDFDRVFLYKAMNLSGIGLKEDDFAEVREGKYIQIIAITYEPDKNGKKKAKNISLGYFGKAETLDATLKNEIIEFVLRWRYEKAFQNVEHYKDLIARVDI